MNEKDLEYLRDMREESYERVFSKEEIERIGEALRTNVGANDTTEAIDLVVEIIHNQQFEIDKHDNIELFHGLVDEVIYHGGLLGADDAVKEARFYEAFIAPKYIDKGRYQEFEKMVEKGFDPLSKYVGSYLIDDVRTLSGAEYLDKKGLIPEGYFTEYDEKIEEPPLFRASLEQIDFYIAHGADATAENNMGQTLPDKMIYSACPVESIKKVCEAGGRISEPEDTVEMLVRRVTKDYAYQLRYYGEKSVKNALDTISFMIEIVGPSKDLNVLISNPELFEKYPEQMQKIFGNEVKVKEQLARIKSKKEQQRKINEQGIDPLAEKEKQIERAIDGAQGPLHMRRGRSTPGEWAKLPEETREKMRAGKTADAKTGEIRDEHKAAAEVQTKTAKEFMKKKRQSRE